MAEDAQMVGSYFNPEGYEEVARMKFDVGDVIVCHNNSTHYLVGVRWDEAMTDGSPDLELIGSFRYDTDFKSVFITALHFAVQWVSSHTEDGNE